MKTFLWLRCLCMCLMLLTGCGLDGPIPGAPKRDAPRGRQVSRAEQKPAAAEKAAPEKAGRP